MAGARPGLCSGRGPRRASFSRSSVFLLFARWILPHPLAKLKMRERKGLGGKFFKNFAGEGTGEESGEWLVASGEKKLGRVASGLRCPGVCGPGGSSELGVNRCEWQSSHKRPFGAQGKTRVPEPCRGRITGCRDNRYGTKGQKADRCVLAQANQGRACLGALSAFDKGQQGNLGTDGTFP